ncbi:pentapeptide repeat-containing protein [Anabaena aphanizomenioides LEGE 00250]|uniref:Serine/threonine-protein kinase B n=1 Tax=Sphaerospermopsis aphanizomenoides LEGE 00250 TaxID=2777972 RepID=A0ABR9VCY4_9CYAN|nr:serine/threonine-protein kinase [Sphaerospermopsis aphanizomenoides]MBE9235275.1 pentapeptide repeat-containing protein [Sphaerospermopsis aphanizomenoides LEGE 00250]
MSYCFNPTCPQPKNSASSQRCLSCGDQLLLIGKCGQYRAIKQLGLGGFGATFLAQNEVLPGEPSCVIKQLRPSGTAPHILEMARDLFEREAKTLGKIGNHPQIPRLLDYFEQENQFYLVQEYISGATLQQEVKKTGCYSEVGVKQFLSEILPLLQYIHELKVIHRDIKPANLIRRSQDARLVLIDFGAVKNQVGQVASNPSGQTALTAYAIGTPGFAPPEQMAMRPVYASDIYALGVTCIYLLTGKTPKDLPYNPTTGEMLWEQLVNVSGHFASVLKKMLEVSVRNRYQSAPDVLRALEMEPYLESLAKGLIVKPDVKSDTDIKERTYNTPDNSAVLFNDSVSSSNNSNNGNGLSQVADAIRARRAKLGENSALQAGRRERKQLMSQSPNLLNSNSTGSQAERKLSSQTLLTAYMKGRRDFASYNISLLNLQSADLSGTNFHSAQLTKTNLKEANLENSDFGRANLKEANLKDANLSKAYLSHADLEGADLRGADLSYAYMSQANLRGANLCGANLTGAKVTDEQLALAKINWLTVRPNGKRGFF